MGRRATACLAAVCAAALSGCGTLVNCVGWNGPGAHEIYGGVKQDAQNGVEHLNEAFHGQAPSFSSYPQMPTESGQLAAKSVCAACGVGMLAVDMPISFVADTLTLPFTIPATLAKPDKTKRKQPPRKAKTITPIKPDA